MIATVALARRTHTHTQRGEREKKRIRSWACRYSACEGERRNHDFCDSGSSLARCANPAVADHARSFYNGAGKDAPRYAYVGVENTECLFYYFSMCRERTRCQAPWLTALPTLKLRSLILKEVEAWGVQQVEERRHCSSVRR